MRPTTPGAQAAARHLRLRRHPGLPAHRPQGAPARRRGPPAAAGACGSAAAPKPCTTAPWRSSLPASIGTRVSAAAREQSSAKVTTRDSCWYITPARVLRVKMSGRKTTSVVRVLAVMAVPTSSLPFTAAASGSSPPSR